MIFIEQRYEDNPQAVVYDKDGGHRENEDANGPIVSLRKCKQKHSKLVSLRVGGKFQQWASQHSPQIQSPSHVWLIRRTGMINKGLSIKIRGKSGCQMALAAYKKAS